MINFIPQPIAWKHPLFQVILNCATILFIYSNILSNILSNFGFIFVLFKETVF